MSLGSRQLLPSTPTNMVTKQNADANRRPATLGADVVLPVSIHHAATLACILTGATTG